MTIEQKLSAIKAINEEKEIIETMRNRLSGKTLEVSLSEEGEAPVYLPMPVEIRVQIKTVLEHYYNKRLAVLIDKATELMK